MAGGSSSLYLSNLLEGRLLTVLKYPSVSCHAAHPWHEGVVETEFTFFLKSSLLIALFFIPGDDAAPRVRFYDVYDPDVLECCSSSGPSPLLLSNFPLLSLCCSGPHF